MVLCADSTPVHVSNHDSLRHLFPLLFLSTHLLNHICLLINKVYRFIYNTISSKIFKIPNQFETLYPFVNSTREGLYLTAEHMFVLNVALPYHHRYSSINRKQLFHSFRKWRLGYAKVRKGEPAT